MEINKEGKAAIFSTDTELYSISQTADNRVVLYNTYTPASIDEPLKRFNINLTQVIKALNCVKQTESFSEFNILNNSFSYQDEMIKFNIRLLNDNLLMLPKINPENIKNFPFTSEIYIESDVIKDIKRVLDFSIATDKFYIEVENDKLYFLFGDKAEDTANIQNDIRILVSDKFNGAIPSNIFNVNILKLIEKSKNDLVFKVGKNAMMVQIQNENSMLQYLTTSLKK